MPTEWKDYFSHTYEYRCENLNKVTHQTLTNEIIHWKKVEDFKLFSSRFDRLLKIITNTMTMDIFSLR